VDYCRIFCALTVGSALVIWIGCGVGDNAEERELNEAIRTVTARSAQTATARAARTLTPPVARATTTATSTPTPTATATPSPPVNDEDMTGAVPTL
jgi:hypothetical protein